MSEYDDGGFIHSSPKKDYKQQQRNLRSLTIKHLKTANIEQNPYQLDNSGLSHIQLIGFVSNVKEISGKGKGFDLNDNTDVISCTYWISSDHSSEVCGFISERNLLRVVGNIRVNQSKISFTVAMLKIVDDVNFMTFHYLNCIHQFLFYNNRLKRCDIKKSSKKFVPMEAGFSRLQSDILDIYRKYQEDDGLHTDAVVKMLGGKYQESEIRDTIECLLSDCHLYSISDMHYKTTY
ncbi:hypothetical protein EDEG_01961 [Edhazardia aedis USNM 41457]|uniref:Replication protein A C-terminal domain-containing protein n=1 Tax=Edhazardia aedis (strain USNM 41457) TaxID=1003232 RepID=J9D7K1_EDHAE|nr:hypothetical protein EDEG_01961 [Edhazardia aedis USNM 41457]|eukprot:EJW03766.1 hypothetical protein EDEG_01961 [Edhazardia aedis USNM 41457]